MRVVVVEDGVEGEELSTDDGAGAAVTRFEDFVAARGGRLLRTAYLLSAGSWPDAEDLVQIALEKAYRHWKRIDIDAGPERYVKKILVNTAISRARRRRVLQEIRMASPPDRPARGETDVVEDRAIVLAELDRLPPRQRAVLVLRYWEDRSEVQTAELMGCSLGTVKSQAARGLARIRRNMARDAGRHARERGTGEESRR